MENKAIHSIQDDAREFLLNLQAIEDLRSTITELSPTMSGIVDEAIRLDEMFLKKVENITTANLALREQYNIISSTVIFVSLNINEQRKLIEKLSGLGFIDSGAEKRLKYRVLMLTESIEKALSLVQQIEERNYEIVFLDHLIAVHKGISHEGLQQCRNLLDRLLTVTGSVFSDTAGRGWPGSVMRQIREEVKLAGTGNREVIRGLIRKMAQASGTLKGIANKIAAVASDRSGLRDVAGQYDDDSSRINDLLNKKNQLFSINKELMAELAVILSLEIGDYMKARDFLERQAFDDFPGPQVRRYYNDLKVHILLACSHVESLMDLSQYMVELFDSNAKREEQNMVFAQKNLDLSGELRKEVDNKFHAIDTLLGVIGKSIEIAVSAERLA